MKHRQLTLLRKWIQFLVLFIIMVAVVGCYSDPHEPELRSAFERYLTVLSEAYVTLDPTKLSEVAVSPRLDAAIDDIDSRKNFTEIASEEFQVESVKVLSYTDLEAVIEVRWNYRQYTQSFDGGERNYGPTDRWYWRIVKVTLVKDGDVWKVKEIEFVDWSG
jgi:hypothetical protein